MVEDRAPLQIEAAMGGNSASRATSGRI
jgi:hypothetical protein